MVRGKSENLRKGEESQGKSQRILTGCLKVKVLPLLRFNLMISVSANMLYLGVVKNSLRSRRSQGNTGEMKVEKQWPCIKMRPKLTTSPLQSECLQFFKREAWSA